MKQEPYSPPDVLSFLEKQHIDHEVRTRGSGEWIVLNCPFCRDHEQHLGIRVGSWTCYCWHCGSLRLVDTLAQMTRVNKHDIFVAIQRKGDRIWRTRTERRRGVGEVKMPPGASAQMPLSHHNYLLKRGFSHPHALAKMWDLLFTTISKSGWNYRIIIPYKDDGGEVITYQGRSIDNLVFPPYRALEDENSIVPVKHSLYGEHLVLGSSVVVVEGAVDVWKLGPGALGTAGTGWTRLQLKRLLKYDNRYILYDPEPKAQASAEELAAELNALDGKYTAIVKMRKKDEDPGALPIKRARRLMLELIGCPLA